MEGDGNYTLVDLNKYLIMVERLTFSQNVERNMKRATKFVLFSVVGSFIGGLFRGSRVPILGLIGNAGPAIGSVKGMKRSQAKRKKK